jgi:signal transduction histidine kinase
MYAEASLRLLDAGDVEKARGYLEQVRETAFDSLREMRLLVFELHPPDVDKEGLVSSLQARLAAVEGRAGLHADFQVIGLDDQRLPGDIEVDLHGIAREALNNVLKHARASRITVRLERGETDVVLEVRDDGVGFEVDDTERGLGLRGMAQRAEALGGRLSVTSGVDCGTCVRVVAPAAAKPKKAG